MRAHAKAFSSTAVAACTRACHKEVLMESSARHLEKNHMDTRKANVCCDATVVPSQPTMHAQGRSPAPGGLCRAGATNPDLLACLAHRLSQWTLRVPL